MPKLLEAGDANAVPPAHPERRWDSIQSGLHQVCGCVVLKESRYMCLPVRFLCWMLISVNSSIFSVWLPGGCATAMSPRAMTAYRAMKPLRCSVVACSNPSSLWLDASSWRSSEWRRTNCYQRNAHSSSHTFPSKGRLSWNSLCLSALMTAEKDMDSIEQHGGPQRAHRYTAIQGFWGFAFVHLSIMMIWPLKAPNVTFIPFIHWWKELRCQLLIRKKTHNSCTLTQPTGAIWASVSCPRTLWHAD